MSAWAKGVLAHALDEVCTQRGATPSEPRRIPTGCEAAVRRKLIYEVPLNTRRTWSRVDLRHWWHAARDDVPKIRLDRCLGDDAYDVQAMCFELVGEGAG